MKRHKSIYDLKENEQMLVKSFGGNVYVTEWIVQRVTGGWIYHEENPRITRTPMVIFVPLSSEFMRFWKGRHVSLKDDVNMNNFALEGLQKEAVYEVTDERPKAIKVEGSKYWINKIKFYLHL